MKYFFIAGEASGDLHASNVIRSLKNIDSESSFVGFGGVKMREAGCNILLDYSQMAFMGILTVILRWKDILNNFRIARNALIEEKPDVLVLVDYPSFNLQIAKFTKNKLKHTRIYYYIPPKVWAWKTFRLRQLARYCDSVFAIFPFEVSFYKKRGYACTYVGNPTIESIRMWQKNKATSPFYGDHPFIAVLPGSRESEIRNCLPLMLKVARCFPKYKIIICQAPNIPQDIYLPFIKESEGLLLDTYGVLSEAALAIVNSGTATLETALLGCPQVAVYHVAFSKVLYWLKPFMFKTKYFTLVNILSGSEVIQELVANKFTFNNLYNEVKHIIEDETYRRKMTNSYAALKNILGELSACENVAKRLVKIKYD